MTSGDLACVIVFYNPDEKAVRNAAEYSDMFTYIIVVDNSDKDNGNRLPAKDNIRYIFNGKNYGIAKALNIGIKEADNKSFKYVLMMDQDSLLPENSLKALVQTIEVKKNEKWGIISSFPDDRNYGLEKLKGTREISMAITSGSILNMEAYKNAGPFEDELFIDCVDHEYCLRLRKLGYKIYQNCEAEMPHSLGSMETREMFGRKFSVTNHAPVRYYYRTRNSLYVGKKYKKEFPEYRKAMIKNIFADMFKVVFFEKKKTDKLFNILKGIASRTSIYQDKPNL